MSREIGYLLTAFPNTCIIWVDVLQRLYWGTDTFNIHCIERKRKRINRWGRQLVTSSGKSDCLTIDIDISPPCLLFQ